MHSLIVGMTESGKSTLGKLLAQSLLRAKHPVAVYDPLHDPSWKYSFHSSDIQEFSEYLERNRNVFAFVDECGKAFNQGNDATYEWLATKSRHWGHSVTFLAQRAIQVPKTMRDQCNRLYLFTSSAGDGKLHAEEWNKPVLQTCNGLPRLTFYEADRYTRIRKLEVVDYRSVQVVSGRNASRNVNPDRNAIASVPSREVDSD